jgi:hypothetical protein
MKAHLVHPVGTGVESIIAEFIADIKNDQDACRHPDGHSKNVDGREKFILQNISDGDLKIVP